jgi:hypothetical protein
MNMEIITGGWGRAIVIPGDTDGVPAGRSQGRSRQYFMPSTDQDEALGGIACYANRIMVRNSGDDATDRRADRR